MKLYNNIFRVFVLELTLVGAALLLSNHVSAQTCSSFTATGLAECVYNLFTKEHSCEATGTRTDSCVYNNPMFGKCATTAYCFGGCNFVNGGCTPSNPSCGTQVCSDPVYPSSTPVPTVTPGGTPNPTSPPPQPSCAYFCTNAGSSCPGTTHSGTCSNGGTCCEIIIIPPPCGGKCHAERVKNEKCILKKIFST